MELELFCQHLPKIELHAHLNGSLSEDTLKRLGCLDESISEYQRLTKLFNKTEKTLNECFELFNVAQNATSDKNSVYLATKYVINEFSNDNVIYLELRTTPRCGKDMTKADYIESVVQAIKDNTADIIVKLLLSINRVHDTKASQDSMNLFIELRQKYPDIIRGVDLSGNPNVGHFDKDLCKQAIDNGLSLSLHCAEVKNDEEVKAILNFSPSRIGHATFIHPRYGGSDNLWNLYCQKAIPIECCLTSNVLCGTSKDYKQHHLGEWIKNSLPFTLSTDDKGVFCTSMSQEFSYAAKYFELTPGDLWNISYNAVNYTFASDEEKSNLKRKMEQWKLDNPF